MLTIIFLCVRQNNIDRNSHAFLQDGTFCIFAGGIGEKCNLFVLLPLSGTGASSRPFLRPRQKVGKQNSQAETPEQREVTNSTSDHSFCSFSHITIDLKTDLSQQ